MRIRSTKPEFWLSERIASVDWDARLVLKGLESYVDDNGVGVDDIALIVAEIFPRDMLANASETVARVSDAITHLFQAGLVWRYEAKGKRLLYISFWESIQRIDKPGKGRFPRPDGTLDYGESQIRESVASPRETVAPGTEEQRNRGTEESSSLTLVEGGAGGDPRNLPVAAKAAPADTRRGHRLPDGWMPSPDTIAAMRQQFPHVDLEAVHEEFTDYWRGVPGAKGRKLDWEGTWRNRVREVAGRQRAPTRNGNHAHALQGADLRAAENEALKRQLHQERQ